MHLIIGLGNPDEEYKSTRHNAGFMVVDALAEKFNLTWENNKKFRAQITPTFFPPLTKERNKEGFRLVKPMNFMNNSGESVQAVLAFYHLLPKKLGLFKVKNCNLSDELTVIHDDIDIELGQYKISVDSRSAGHKGVQSVIDHLRTKNFKRIRIGIRTEMAERIPAEKFVLQKFGDQELIIIKNMIEKIIKAIA